MEKEASSSEGPDAARDEMEQEKNEQQQQQPQQQSNHVSQTSPAEASAPTPAPPLPQTRSLPQWLDRFNRRDLTTTLRCIIAVWVASLLMVINPSLRRFGQSTFLASVVIYIIPPAGNLIVAIVGYLSLLLGMCLAWAWGLATMKAAQAVRSPAELNARLQALQQQVGATAQATGNNDTAAIATVLIHDGFMLDTRVTVVYFVMGCVFVYFISRLRYTFNLTVLTQLFGIIATDIFLVIGPTITRWTPRLPEVVVLPAACGCAIGIACALFIFPQSTSQVAVGQIQDLLAMLNYPIQTGRQFVAGSLDLDTNLLKRTKRRAITAYAQLQPNIAFLPLDVSRGQWSPDDVKSVYIRFQDVLAATFALLDFQIARVSSQDKIDKLRDMVNLPQTASSDGKEAKPRDPRRAKILQNPDLIHALIAPGTIVGSEDMHDALHGSSEAVLDITTDAISHLVEALNLVNMNRWFVSKSARARFPQAAIALRQIGTKLTQAREACIADTTKAAIDIHGNLFDDNGLIKTEMKDESKKIAGLVIAFVIEEHIIVTATAYEKLTAEVAQLLETRTTNQVWGPLKRLFTPDPRQETGAPALSGQTVTDPDRIQRQTREVERRIKVVSKGHGIPKKRGNLIARAVAAVSGWLTAPGSLYALRVVIVTIATGIPAVIPHTAGFYYREKGIWTLVTAQTCILMYMSDFTFSIITRTVATVFGGIAGLVIWYISAGTGGGNPYGLGAALPFGIVLFVWARLWLPQAYLQGTGLGASTFAMVIGYSWDMHHLSTYGLPGLGYTTFWRRLVTVLIGFAAALIVQMLPKPPSGTRHVAKTLANSLHKISDHYALLISHWGSGSVVGDDYSGVRNVITSAGLGLGQKLYALNDPIAMLKYETSMSPFDKTSLRRVQELLISMNQSLTKVMLAGTTLPPEYQQRLIKTSGIADDACISKIMSVLVLAKQSLRSGAPLPERLPTPLIATCYLDFGVRHGFVELRREYMESEDFRSYCVALSAYLTFLHTADDLVLLLKETVGESHIVHDWSELSEEV
ncbi:protein (fungal and plant) [Beauveria bassiana ARSEF 2860]|uniref:Protein (Fungal and plant) n=1 Tax=Beauveria bassiana (strain ARSEF 2860) TaxID=655819 RepID=J4WK09_BEAB2|nr:protein (fungal and plant) [Beauveria bassiana ARSEF 2860]EJP70130.1 protein (fungal and plant) [Beauveria bassiana ARSEF 2860]